ncbi:MAG: amino acid permease [Pseudomonadota bacterium]
MASQRQYGSVTAISIVVANMIGTGVFTSLGFQLLNIQSGFAILALWAAGGVAAFCGAVSYAELAAALPRSGGEYHFVSRIYHPAAGFVSGWVSATVGFAAPTALAAMTFAAYLSSALGGEASADFVKPAACALVISLAVLHSWRRAASGGFQTVFTTIKALVIIGFCLAAFFIADDRQAISFAPHAGDLGLILSEPFAVSLIYVSFAYTGWNAATYITGEIKNAPARLPLVLALGSGLVTILYVSLNAAFLMLAPVEALAGKIEIGFIAAQAMFGERAAAATGVVMAVLLVSTVSAMTIAGPRVLSSMGEDYPALRVLSAKTRDAIPRRAIFLQAGLAIVFILTSSFQSILVFAGALVALNSFITVIGLFVLRLREPSLERPYRVFAYPLAPLTYIALTAWTLWFTLRARPQQGLVILAVILVGFGVYRLAARRRSNA